jgi:hypothetical protein
MHEDEVGNMNVDVGWHTCKNFRVRQVLRFGDVLSLCCITLVLQ